MTAHKIRTFPPSPLAGETTVDLPATSMPHASFWQRPFVQNVLPLCTSMALHAAFVVMGIAAYRAVVHITAPKMEQIIVPETAAMDDAADAGILGGHSAGAQVFQPNFMDVKGMDGLSQTQGRDLGNALSGGPAGTGTDAAVIAIGLTTTNPGGGTGSGSDGKGDGPGGPVGKLAPFGVPSGGTGRDGPPIFRSANAQRIVYVLDATGSMMSSFDALRMQVRMAVTALRPPRSFNIVFINEGNPPPLAPTLLFATPEAKRKAAEYVDTTAPRGSTNPLPALEKAFALKPDLIHLFIDPTDFPDKQAVLDLVTAKSGNGKIKLNILAFEGHDPENEAFLKSLAEKTGGLYRFVTRGDLDAH